MIQKRSNCLYCESKMESKTAKKKFCSAKCRVYYKRELARGTLLLPKVGGVIENDNPTVPSVEVVKRKQHNHSLTLTVAPKKVNSDAEPTEGTNRFFLKYGAFTFAELKNKEK